MNIGEKYLKKDGLYTIKSITSKMVTLRDDLGACYTYPIEKFLKLFKSVKNDKK
jgi:hypothetical protein